MSFKLKDIISLMMDYFKIKLKLCFIKDLFIVLLNKDNELLESVIWFGYFVFFLKIEGKKLLLDFMFGDVFFLFFLFNSKCYSGIFFLECDDF